MGSDDFSFVSAHPADNDGYVASACCSVCSASDCMHSPSSFPFDAPFANPDGARSHGNSATSGRSCGKPFAVQRALAAPSEPRIACQAAIFFEDQNAAAAAVGCPCKSCVTTVASMSPADGQPQQSWRYQRPEEQQRTTSHNCHTLAFESRGQVTFDDQPWAVSPASADSPADQTLQTLLDRAEQGFTATAGASSTRPPQTLRCAAPAAALQPFYQRLQAPPIYPRRPHARTTSPIPVPSPLPRSPVGEDTRRGRRAPALTAQSVGEAPYDSRRGSGYDEDGVVHGKNLQHDKMMTAMVRLYGAMRQQRVRPLPGRPLEPLSVVIGFEPKPWPAGGDVLVS